MDSPVLIVDCFCSPSLQLPFYALIAFACFLLARLGYMILTFNDVPEEHKLLQQEIEQARVELRKANVDVD
jgi:dolichyl-phosphate mannosyltransferase polypeptide 3